MVGGALMLSWLSVVQLSIRLHPWVPPFSSVVQVAMWLRAWYYLLTEAFPPLAHAHSNTNPSLNPNVNPNLQPKPSPNLGPGPSPSLAPNLAPTLTLTLS